MGKLDAAVVCENPFSAITPLDQDKIVCMSPKRVFEILGCGMIDHLTLTAADGKSGISEKGLLLLTRLTPPWPRSIWDKRSRLVFGSINSSADCGSDQDHVVIELTGGELEVEQDVRPGCREYRFWATCHAGIDCDNSVGVMVTVTRYCPDAGE